MIDESKQPEAAAQDAPTEEQGAPEAERPIPKPTPAQRAKNTLERAQRKAERDAEAEASRARKEQRRAQKAERAQAEREARERRRAEVREAREAKAAKKAARAKARNRPTATAEGEADEAQPVVKARGVRADLPEGKGLDFAIIGAQRSGTTSLWMHLSSHPSISMPSDKEAPFFSNDNRFQMGLKRYLGRYFATAPADTLWGTASPQYMRGTLDATPDKIARRISEVAPDLRMIAILREPISRAQSQHRYAVRRGQETRSFEEAAWELLQPERLEEGRTQPSKTNTFLVLGEYGRILRSYAELFPREQLLILFTSDLDERPLEVASSCFGHLGVDPDHVPPGLESRHHQGGSSTYVPEDRVEELRTYLLESVWKRVPEPPREELRRGFEYWFRQWNVVPEPLPSPDGLDRELRTALKAHYDADAHELSEALGIHPPWASRPILRA